MQSLGFWKMTRPLRLFMSSTNQFWQTGSPVRVFFWLLTNGSLMLLTVLALVQLLAGAAKELGTALEIVTILTTLIECCFRVLYLCCQQKKIMNLISVCQHFPVSCKSFKSSEKLLQNFAMERNRKVMILFFGYIFLILIGYLSLPFLPRAAPEKTSDITASIVREYPMYIPIWLPWSSEMVQSTPVYQSIVLWQALCFVVLVSVFCSADCLLYSFIIFLVEGLRHLERVTPNMPAAELPKGRRSLNYPRVSAEPVDEYRIYIQQHQFILNVAEELELLFGPIIFATFATNGFVMCVLAYVLVKLNDLVGILCVTGHLSCIVIKLLVMAYFGQNLIDESERLKMSMPFKIWPRMGEGKDRDAQIISLRCSSPVTLTGLKFFNLAMEIFGKVCSVALGYFIVLLQIH